MGWAADAVERRLTPALPHGAGSGMQCRDKAGIRTPGLGLPSCQVDCTSRSGDRSLWRDSSSAMLGGDGQGLGPGLGPGLQEWKTGRASITATTEHALSPTEVTGPKARVGSRPKGCSFLNGSNGFDTSSRLAAFSV